MSLVTITLVSLDSQAEEDTESIPIESVEVEQSDSLFSENRNRDNEQAIQAVNSGMKVDIENINSVYDYRDIATRIALFFTVVAVGTLWVISTIRDKNDPVRKWLR